MHHLLKGRGALNTYFEFCIYARKKKEKWRKMNEKWRKKRQTEEEEGEERRE